MTALLGTGRKRNGEQNVELVLASPIEGLIDILDIRSVKSRERTVFAKNVPRNGQTHRIIATIGDLLKIGLSDEALYVLLYELAVGVFAQLIRKRNGVEG